jgi:hypothetical protein
MNTAVIFLRGFLKEFLKLVIVVREVSKTLDFHNNKDTKN